MREYVEIRRDIVAQLEGANELPLLLWLMFLSDRKGSVNGSIPGLARLGGWKERDVALALRSLVRGGVIEETEHGWAILNPERFMKVQGESTERVRRHRARKRRAEERR